MIEECDVGGCEFECVVEIGVEEDVDLVDVVWCVMYEEVKEEYCENVGVDEVLEFLDECENVVEFGMIE